MPLAAGGPARVITPGPGARAWPPRRVRQRPGEGRTIASKAKPARRAAAPRKAAHHPKRLTHLDARGQARMVDVGAKPETERVAVASARVRMESATLRLLRTGRVAKGDALAVARLAGIQAAKETASLIPLAHPIPVTSVEVSLVPKTSPARVEVEARVKTTAKTGVEMEALVAASVAALALYDMCKAADRAMTIEAVRLEYKSGGKSGTFERAKTRKKK